jgi:hypothetical protein
VSTKGKWLIGDRLAAGCRALAAGGAAWFAARDVEKRRGRTAVARLLGGGLSVSFVGGTVYALSRGALLWGSVVVGLMSAWVAGGPQERQERAPQGLDPAAFLELVHDVAGGGNVHLTAIGDQLSAETGRCWDVLALCRAAGIPTKPVRVAGADPAVTTGIHRYDLPPLPRSSREGAVVDVSAGQDDNNNTTVTEVGQAAVIVKHGPSIRQGVRR